jgi:metal-dependent amidase/aminoacylase/carboxypeptidase family protein
MARGDRAAGMHVLVFAFAAAFDAPKRQTAAVYAASAMIRGARAAPSNMPPLCRSPCRDAVALTLRHAITRVTQRDVVATASEHAALAK